MQLNQTHAQTLQAQAQSLQAQVQSLQALQEQYANIMTTLSPLIPLLQAIPLHVETVRTCVTDTLLKMNLAPTQKPEQRDRSTSEISMHLKSTSRSERPPSSQTLSSKKRRRLDAEGQDVPEHSNDLDQHVNENHPPALPRSMQHSSPLSESNSLRRRLTEKSCNLRFRTPYPHVSPFTVGNSSTRQIFQRSTPRRPLGDLPLPMQNFSTPLASKRPSHPPISSSANIIPNSHCLVTPTTTTLGQSHQIQRLCSSISQINVSPLEPHSGPAPIESSNTSRLPSEARPSLLPNKKQDLSSTSSKSRNSLTGSRIFSPSVEARDQNSLRQQDTAVSRIGTPLSSRTVASRQASPTQLHPPTARPGSYFQRNTSPLLPVARDNAPLDPSFLPKNSPLPVTRNKPMSIKDRRAYGLLAQAPFVRLIVL